MKVGYSILPDSIRFAAMYAKNLLLPTPAISQTSPGFACSLARLLPRRGDAAALRRDEVYKRQLWKHNCALNHQPSKEARGTPYIGIDNSNTLEYH